MATSKNVPAETVTTKKNEHLSFIDNGRKVWSKYGKIITYSLGLIFILVAAFISYQQFVIAPKEEKANDLIFPAENLFDKMAASGFNKDSVNIVLNGGALQGTNVTGLLKIINNYGATDAGNRANYMAGASYLNIGEYAKAIKYLKDFNGNGANQVQVLAYQLTGQAYAEQKNTSEALTYFKKAAGVNEKDDVFTAEALLLAANYADATGNTKEAIDLFQKLKNNYPQNSAVSSGDVEKQLARLGIFE